MPDIMPCGDAEIDAVRAKVGQSPTQQADYPYHVAILTTWINLLHRQGADLADYAPIFDQLKASRDNGDIDRLCATIDEAFAFLDAVQTSLEPPTATQVKPVRVYEQPVRLRYYAKFSDNAGVVPTNPV